MNNAQIAAAPATKGRNNTWTILLAPEGSISTVRSVSGFGRIEGGSDAATSISFIGLSVGVCVEPISSSMLSASPSSMHHRSKSERSKSFTSSVYYS